MFTKPLSSLLPPKNFCKSYAFQINKAFGTSSVRNGSANLYSKQLVMDEYGEPHKVVKMKKASVGSLKKGSVSWKC